MESKLYNNCLNRKLGIDIHGNIKNCTALNKSYGNLKDSNLIEIVSSLEFQKLWLIKKDDIMVCKDCEFRYMCSDCRAFTENNDLYGKPKYCRYNPYKMEWNK
jgi:SPASM domain peptide maturase of grasp-with-spasm system